MVARHRIPALRRRVPYSGEGRWAGVSRDAAVAPRDRAKRERAGRHIRRSLIVRGEREPGARGGAHSSPEAAAWLRLTQRPLMGRLQRPRRGRPRDRRSLRIRLPWRVGGDGNPRRRIARPRVRPGSAARGRETACPPSGWRTAVAGADADVHRPRMAVQESEGRICRSWPRRSPGTRQTAPRSPFGRSPRGARDDQILENRRA